MSIPTNFDRLVGNWHGKNLLHLSWVSEKPFESESAALIETTARGAFLKIEYGWMHDAQPQEGLILIGQDKNSDAVKAFWIDSWHLSDKFMVSDGHLISGEKVSIKGFYAVPENPDWGWRT